MRPFFNYYGGKWRLAPRYPAPAYDTIIEPFAGAAGYSTRYHEKRVILCDLDPILAGVWRYLIAASADEIMRLPLIEHGQNVDDLGVCQEARWLIGFWLNKGSASPKKTMSAWGREPRNARHFWGENIKRRIAGQVGKIDHWQVMEGPYASIGNADATWFVDPPYQAAGRHYRKNAVDFAALGEWCADRRGQVIVCENAGADWLPFQPLAKMHGANRKRSGSKRSAEVVWIQDNGQGRFYLP